jgi:hypothetical protein
LALASALTQTEQLDAGGQYVLGDHCLEETHDLRNLKHQVSQQTVRATIES